MSESYDAEEVVALLNDYFARMNMVIEKYDGDIDKFIGDAIMAQFISKDEPGFEPETMAFKAVQAGMAMMDALKDFNRQRELENKFPIMIGVGINSGEVIAGNIGSPGRMDHTVIGDTVNVASRLEGMSKKGRHSHVIISSSTLELVKDNVEYEKLEETAVKGKTSAVDMFEIISIKH
jgi:adenylate cyclase